MLVGRFNRPLCFVKILKINSCMCGGMAGPTYLILSLSIGSTSALALLGFLLTYWAGRTGKSISAKLVYKFFAFSVLTLQMFIYPFPFLRDKEPFPGTVTYHSSIMYNRFILLKLIFI